MARACPATESRRVRGLDELQQPVALGLDDLLLLLLQQLGGDAHPALDGLGEDAVEVDARQPGGHLGQRRRGDLGDRGQPLPLELRLDEVQPLLLGGQAAARCSRRRGCAPAAAEISARFSTRSTMERSPARNWGSLAHFTRVASTNRSSAERLPISPAGGERLGEVDDQRQRLPVGQAHPQVVLEDLQRPARVARQHLGVVGAVERVVCREGPGEVLLRLRAGGADAARAVVVQDVVAAAEQLLGEELLQRPVGAVVPRAERLQVAHRAVQQEGADRLGVVGLGELLRPGRQVGQRVAGLAGPGWPSGPGL